MQLPTASVSSLNIFAHIPCADVWLFQDPGSSGEALTQRLMRLRKELVAEGHLVPPAPQKPGGPIEDVAVRGFVRAHPDR